jgi:hypothetical protein
MSPGGHHHSPNTGHTHNTGHSAAMRSPNQSRSSVTSSPAGGGAGGSSLLTSPGRHNFGSEGWRRADSGPGDAGGGEGGAGGSADMMASDSGYDTAAGGFPASPSPSTFSGRGLMHSSPSPLRGSLHGNHSMSSQHGSHSAHILNSTLSIVLYHLAHILNSTLSLSPSLLNLCVSRGTHSQQYSLSIEI